MCQPGMGHSGSTEVLERPNKSKALASRATPALESASLPRLEATSQNASGQKAAEKPAARSSEPREEVKDKPAMTGSGNSAAPANRTSQQSPKPVKESAPVPPVAAAPGRAPSAPSRPEPVRPSVQSASGTQAPKSQSPQGQKAENRSGPAPRVAAPPSRPQSITPPAPPAKAAIPPSEPVKPVFQPMTRDQALKPDGASKMRNLGSAPKSKAPAAENAAPETVPAEILGKHKDAIRTVLSQSIQDEARTKDDQRRARNEEASLRRLYKLAWNVDPRATELTPQNLSEYKARILRGIQMHFGEEFASLEFPKFLTPVKK